jgi:hypothetical protein
MVRLIALLLSVRWKTSARRTHPPARISQDLEAPSRRSASGLHAGSVKRGPGEVRPGRGPWRALGVCSRRCWRDVESLVRKRMLVRQLLLVVRVHVRVAFRSDGRRSRVNDVPVRKFELEPAKG